MARNGRYETHVQPRLQSIQAWRRRGLSEQEISDNLGIARSSLQIYKAKHPKLIEALKSGKSDANAQVENALFKRAMGYEYEEVKHIATKKGKDGKEMVGRIERTTKQVAPDVTAQIFYLKNRAANRWRDRYGHELTGADGEALRPNVVLYLPQKQNSGNPVDIEPPGGNGEGVGVNRLIESKSNGGKEGD